MPTVYIELNKFFPLSRKGHQCITHCYSSASIIYHPLKNKSHIDYDSPACAIMPKVTKKKKHSKSKKKKKIYFDKCWSSSQGNYNLDSNSRMYMYNQGMYFCRVVLQKVYGIRSYSQAVEFVKKNPGMPQEFKEKILKCSFLLY